MAFPGGVLASWGNVSSPGSIGRGLGSPRSLTGMWVPGKVYTVGNQKGGVAVQFMTLAIS